MFFGSDQVMPRRNLKNSVVQRPHLMPAEFHGVVQRLCVPARRHSGCKQRFHLRGEEKCFIVGGVKKRLDSKAVARRENRAVCLVPNHKRKFSAQPVQTLCSELFVKMQRNLAVRARAQTVPRPFKFFSNHFVPVKFAVHYDPYGFILIRDRLIACRKIDNAQSRVSKRHPAVRRNPMTLCVGPTMIEAPRRRLQCRG